MLLVLQNTANETLPHMLQGRKLVIKSQGNFIGTKFLCFHHSATLLDKIHETVSFLDGGTSTVIISANSRKVENAGFLHVI